MITITRSLVRQLRAVFRRAGLGQRRGFGTGVPIQFVASADGLRIQAQSHEVAIEYHRPGEFTAEVFALPFEVLAACEGARDDAVTLSLQQDQQIEVCWSDRGLPQAKRFADCSGDSRGVFPSPPDSWTAADQHLLDALREAMETAAKQRIRYTLDCVQLRGATGQMVATDACQLLIQEGFQFPWPNDVLIPRTRVFQSPELGQSAPIALGKTDTHVAFRIGPWDVWLAIEGDAVFPNVEHIVPPVEDIATRFRIAAADGQTLSEVLDRLPAAEEDNSPVTIDCNGHVAIRAKAADHPQVTELVLSRAELTGSPIRLNTNRRFLQRAVALGFQEIQVTSPDKPLLCHDDGRKYIWQTLTPEDALPPTEDCQRIQLPIPPAIARNRINSQTNTTRITRMPHNNHTATNRVAQVTATEPRNGHVVASANGHDTETTSPPTDPITEVLALRESLRQTLTRTNRVVAALRHQRKQHRLVQATLASLRELQTVAS